MYENDSLKFLSSQLSKLPSLTELELQCNKISKENITYLAESLKYCNKLKLLDLYGNRLTPYCVEVLCDVAFKNLPFLESLSLGENKIGKKGVVVLSDYLKYLSNIKVLDLQSNNIPLSGLETFCDKLFFTSQLEVLDLGDNDFNGDGIGCIKQRIEKSLGKRKVEVYF